MTWHQQDAAFRSASVRSVELVQDRFDPGPSGRGRRRQFEDRAVPRKPAPRSSAQEIAMSIENDAGKGVRAIPRAPKL